MRILVTGGLGFIGSNFVRHMLRNRDCSIRAFDAMTYAGNIENLSDVSDYRGLEIVVGNICDQDAINAATEGCDVVVHFAAESHVDRSIHDPGVAIETNVTGTFCTLQAARRSAVDRFILISTDEVYGEAHDTSFAEGDPLTPRNPYSASKAAADRLGHAYFTTYDLPVIVHRAANNYGPYQFPEKLIPLFCYRALRDETLPVYGDGMQVRDWLHVEDNCRAIELLIEKGVPGEAYNVPGGNERPTMDVVRLLLDELGKPESLIRHVIDRPGHDFRYSINGAKLRALGWSPDVAWEAGMRATIRWFAEHPKWLASSMVRGEVFLSEWHQKRGWGIASDEGGYG